MMDLCGFDVVDVHMTDLIEGEKLDDIELLLLSVVFLIPMF